MINYKFDFKKVSQIVNYLLSLNNYRLNYTKLIKLLYFADREALNRWDETITKDSYVNMNKGPVLSKVYDLIKNNVWPESIQVLWDSYFIKNNYDLVSHVKDDLPTDELSAREIELLKEIDEKYKSYNYGYLIELAHKLPEWKDPGNSSNILRVNNILKELGRTEVEIQELEEDYQKYLEEEKIIENCV